MHSCLPLLVAVAAALSVLPGPEPIFQDRTQLASSFISVIAFRSCRDLAICPPNLALQPRRLSTWQRWKTVIRELLGHNRGALSQLSTILVKVLPCPALCPFSKDGMLSPRCSKIWPEYSHQALFSCVLSHTAQKAFSKSPQAPSAASDHLQSGASGLSGAEFARFNCRWWCPCGRCCRTAWRR